MIKHGDFVVVELYGEVEKILEDGKVAVKTDIGTLNVAESVVCPLPLPAHELGEEMPCPNCQTPMRYESNDEGKDAWFCVKCDELWS